MASVVLREDFDAVSVRRLARDADDADQARRLLAIAAVYEGMSRADAARIGGMDRQTLRDWVHRFNAVGAAGLINRTAPGNPRRLTPAQEAELDRLVEAGPVAAGLGHLARWRCADLQALIAERWGVAYHERTTGWHTTGKLRTPDNITLLPLPPRSPELNPAENVWEYLRGRWLSNHIFKDYDAILDAA